MSHDDDFLKQMSDVEPIQQDKVADLNKPQNELNTNYRQKVAVSFGKRQSNFLTDGEVEPVKPDEIIEFKLDGVQPGVYKKLRQGKYGFDDHLDLHRKTVAEAREAVYQLLRHSARNHFRCLLITHGKGLRSDPPARLKSYVNRWLRQVDLVIGFHSAQPQHGGTGSVYVLLRKTEQCEKLNPSKYD